MGQKAEISGLQDAEAAVRVDRLDFEVFFREGHEQLLRAMYLVTGDAEEARDICQEAYLRLWERWERVQEIENRDGYLYRTAMNLWRSRLRQLKRAVRRAGREPADAFAEADARDEVATALRTLTPRQRAAIVLTELWDYPSDRAANLLGVKPSTVRALATQGRERLRARLESSGD